MSVSISLSTDGPADPQYMLELGSGFAEVVRVMNHISRHHSALEYPSELDTLVRDIARGIAGLPQLLSQLGAWLEAERAAGRIEMAAGEYEHRPDAASHMTRLRLDAASADAEQLRSALEVASAITCDMGAPEVREDDGDE